MAEIYFDNVSSSSLGLTFVSGTLAVPEAKTNTVDIPYSNSSIDLTEYFGDVVYKNRTITLSFYVSDYSKKYEVASEVTNLLHGKTRKIIIPSYPDYYFRGRCSVSSTEVSNNKTYQITVSASCYPYRLKNSTTSVTASATGTITLSNDAMPATLNITVDADEVIFTFEGGVYDLTKGTHTLAKALPDGGTDIKITTLTNGSATFEYQEGAL